MIRIAYLLFLSLSCVACSTSKPPVPPGTIPEARDVTVAEEQYGHTVLSKLTEKWPLDYDHARYDEISRIVKRLTEAAQADAYPWHVYLFKAPEIKNAAATRGNHIFVWTGMLDFTKSEPELATVLAHEIAHVLAGHTDPDPNEQIKKLLIGVGAMAAGIATSQATGVNVTQVTAVMTEQLASGILVNPYSRERELEADHIGLFLMADAKYDPRQAIAFWDRAKSDPDFSKTLEFFSTHPLAGDRGKTLEAYLPEALDRYHGRTKQKRPKPSKGTPAPTPKQAKQTEPFSPENDSFNLSGTGASDGEKEWLVHSAKAVLYSRPSLKSKALGEFKRGAQVIGSPAAQGWLRIETPDRGYLRAQDLRKPQ